MHLVYTLAAVLFGRGMKRQETLAPADSPTHYTPIESNTIQGYMTVNEKLSTDTHRYATVYPSGHHYFHQTGGKKVRIAKNKVDSAKVQSIRSTNDSNSSSNDNNSSSSNSQSCPFNIAPLSLFDPAVSKEWNGLMTLNCDSSSVTYNTSTGGQIVLAVEDNNVVVKTLKGMQLSVVTPGAKIGNLKEGDCLDFTSEYGHVLFVNSSVETDTDSLFAATDRLYFYSTGVKPESVKLLPHSMWIERQMDYVKIGLEPKWVSHNEYTPYQQISDPIPMFGSFIRGNVLELADYAMALLLQQVPKEISPSNRVANMSAFFANSDYKQSTILDYIKTITQVTDVSIPAFRYYQTSPVMQIVLIEVARRLYNLQKPEYKRDLWLGYCYGGNMLNLSGPTPDALFKVSTVMSNLMCMFVDFDYQKVQEEARQNPSFTAALFTYIDVYDPFNDYIWNVSEEINKEFPLPPDAKIFFDDTKNYTYKMMLPLVNTNFELALSLIPNVFHRMRSNVDPNLLQQWAHYAIVDIILSSSPSVLREKAEWVSNVYNNFYAPVLPRLCNDLGYVLDWDGSHQVADIYGDISIHTRVKFAQALATKLTLNNSDDNAYAMLKWLPPYLSAYVYDNLNAAGIPNKLTPGVNLWPDLPYADQLIILKSWMNGNWPTDRPHMVTVFITDGNYGYDLQWFSLNPKCTAMSFAAPWNGLDVNNLSTIVSKGTETVAVQSNTDQTASIYIAKCTTRRMIYHLHYSTGLCESYGDTNWKPWTKTVKVEPNDYIMILDDPYRAENIAQWVTDCVKGVQDPESLLFILNGFTSKEADSIFLITNNN